MPQYLVQFQYAPASTSASPACVLCEAKSATLVCKSCPAVLCKGCDVDVHSANKLVARHKRTALNASTAECSKPLVDSTCGKVNISKYPTIYQLNKSFSCSIRIFQWNSIVQLAVHPYVSTARWSVIIPVANQPTIVSSVFPTPILQRSRNPLE